MYHRTFKYTTKLLGLLPKDFCIETHSKLQNMWRNFKRIKCREGNGNLSIEHKLICTYSTHTGTVSASNLFEFLDIWFDTDVVQYFLCNSEKKMHYFVCTNNLKSFFAVHYFSQNHDFDEWFEKKITMKRFLHFILTKY